MGTLTILTPSMQVASYLRGELARGRWEKEMPGGPALAAELGVDLKTAGLALNQLEQEGLLEGQGPGKRRRILLSENHAPRLRNIALLLFEKSDQKLDYLLQVRHELLETGHIFRIAQRTLCDLGKDTVRVIRFLEKNPADAWVVQAGSREVLEFFAARKLPAFAIAGRSAGLDLAGVTIRKSRAISDGVRRLVALGHRRIVLLVREDRRKPYPGVQEQNFLQDLKSNGINPGAYNLPHWEDSVEDFHRCLNALFQVTPPTALLLDEPSLLIAAQQHLTRRGLWVPRDVSMFCLDPSPAFDWCDPVITHVAWDPNRLVSRVVRWAENLAKGMEDRRQTFIKAAFVEGGTIGPVPE